MAVIGIILIFAALAVIAISAVVMANAFETRKRSNCLLIMKLSLIFIPVGIMIGMLGANPRYSEGTRSGVIQKISYKGIFWKTHECEMLLGGAVNDNKGSVPNLWQFTVINQDHIELIKTAMEKGDRVQVDYNQWLLRPAWYGTRYIVSDITFNEDN